jgi:hypothetical protein
MENEFMHDLELIGRLEFVEGSDVGVTAKYPNGHGFIKIVDDHVWFYEYNSEGKPLCTKCYFLKESELFQKC